MITTNPRTSWGPTAASYGENHCPGNNVTEVTRYRRHGIASRVTRHVISLGLFQSNGNYFW